MPPEDQQNAPPQQPQQSADFPIPQLVCEDFGGINTSTVRAGVPDEKMWWCDGFMPIDRRNLRTLYGAGAAIYTRAGIVCFGFFNIGAQPWAVVFHSNGQVDVVQTDTTNAFNILPPGTIVSPTPTNVGFTQWGRQYLIIVANQQNGYWLWDGTNVYTAGTLSPSITLTGVGQGYVSVPLVLISGGSGSGAQAQAQIANGFVTNVQITNPGSGYKATDTVSVAFTGGNQAGSGGSVTVGLVHVAGGSGASLVAVMTQTPGG